MSGSAVLIEQMARENPGRGCKRIQGELLGLGTGRKTSRRMPRLARARSPEKRQHADHDAGGSTFGVGAMAQEAGLGEDHDEERGGAELSPRVAEDGEQGLFGCQRGERDLPGAVAQPSVQQPRLPHPKRQHRVLAAARAG